MTRQYTKMCKVVNEKRFLGCQVFSYCEKRLLKQQDLLLKCGSDLKREQLLEYIRGKNVVVYHGYIYVYEDDLKGLVL